MLVKLNNWEWNQNVSSLLSMKNIQVDGECPKECKHEEMGICCGSFKGNLTIQTIPSISEEQVFYFFNTLKDPRELLTLFRDPYAVRGLIDTDILTFDQQLQITMILDFHSIEACLLRSVLNKSFNPINSILIQTQKICALHFKDWIRYQFIIDLWEAFIVSCLLLPVNNTIYTQLIGLLQDFIKDDVPNDVFPRIARVISILSKVIGLEQVFHIVSDAGQLHRFIPS